MQGAGGSVALGAGMFKRAQATDAFSQEGMNPTKAVFGASAGYTLACLLCCRKYVGLG